MLCISFAAALGIVALCWIADIFKVKSPEILIMAGIIVITIVYFVVATYLLFIRTSFIM